MSDRNQHVATFDSRLSTWIEQHLSIAAPDTDNDDVQLGTNIRITQFATDQR